MTNMFKDVDTAEAVIHQAIGAGSVCWENPGGAGVFDDTQALAVGRDAMERLKEIGL